MMPPGVLQPLVKALLDNCSSMAPPGPIPLAHVLLRTYSTTCCGVSQDHLAAFRKQLWPRHTTVAELEGYIGITTWRSSLSCMEPRERLVRGVAEAVDSGRRHQEGGATRPITWAPAPGCTLDPST